MKKLIVGILACFLCCWMAGCELFPVPEFLTKPSQPLQTEPPEPSETAQQTLPPTEPPTEEPTEPPTEAPTETEGISATEPIATKAPTQPSRFPYIIKVNDPNTPIYSGPGYGYSYEGTVKIAALYTIMEERTDSYGNLWGRLKSGAGWIVLNEGFQPYLVYISDPDYPIYKGPGYEYACVGTVEIAAQYTIVEERYDSWGNLWGRLKSGAGWIALGA